MSFFDKNAVGRLVTRTVNDIETIASIFSQGLFTIIADILKMITVLIVMTVISPELTLVVISIFPVLIFATRVFQKTMKTAFEKVRREVANLNSFVQERISGVKIVQIFNREKVEIDKFNQINIKHRDAWLRTVWINSIFFPIAEKKDNVIMIRTFSKIYGLGGMRVGWGFSSKSVIEALQRVRGPFNLSVPALARMQIPTSSYA